MKFAPKYLDQFYRVADTIFTEYSTLSKSHFEIGKYVESPLQADAVIQLMNIWVRGIDKLLQIIKDNYGVSSSKYRQMYSQRGCTYDEWYYLLNNDLEEEDYLNTPAFIFTKTFSKELRKRRFQDFQYTPKYYKSFILSHDLV